MAESLSESQIARIIDAARAAPSVHNTQPWRFTARPQGVIELHAQIGRALPVSDPNGRALYQSCGAALFNARLGIRMTGHDAVVELLPHPEYPITTLAVIRIEPGEPPAAAERELFAAVWRRHTNRGPFADLAVPEAVRLELERAARPERGAVRWLGQQEAGAVLMQADQAGQTLARDAGHESELRQWIATSSDQDGIPASALAARPASVPAPVRVDDFAAAVPETGRPTATYESSPQLALLTAESDEPEDWLRAGQALQRVLLVATTHGVAASFLGQPIELKDMLGDATPPSSLPANLQMIMRFGYGTHVTATPRRRRDDVLRHDCEPRCGRGALVEL